jgi:hypothetical protein
MSSYHLLSSQLSILALNHAFIACRTAYPCSCIDIEHLTLNQPREYFRLSRTPPPLPPHFVERGSCCLSSNGLRAAFKGFQRFCDRKHYVVTNLEHASKKY